MSEEDLAKLEADLRERLAKIDLPKPSMRYEQRVWALATLAICLAGLATVIFLYFSSGASL